jgi:hypothetical protein
VKYTNVKTEMEIELLKAEHDSENQNKEMMLGRVGGPESNITLHASTSVNGEENER